MSVQVKIMLEEGAKAPERAHVSDAGADLFANEEVVVPRGSWVNIHTGVHVEIPRGYFGLLQSKSGLNINNGITSRGVIDEGYTGEIIVALQNLGPAKLIHKGDKITQLIIIPCMFADFVVTDKIDGGDRGNNGFGSTGK